MTLLFLEKKSLYPYRRYLFLQETLRIRRKELILFCSHAPLITAGIQTKESSFLTGRNELSRMGIEVCSIKRGGDATAHEPGQIVIYIHLDLKKRNIQLSHFFRQIFRITQESIESVWNIPLHYRDEDPGLYSEEGKKIVSGGISFKSFFTAHGIAVNLENSLNTFSHILPCGLKDVLPGSLKEMGADPEKKEAFTEDWKKRMERYLSGPPPSHMHS